jgi:hypothetical protein
MANLPRFWITIRGKNPSLREPSSRALVRPIFSKYPHDLVLPERPYIIMLSFHKKKK